MAEVGFRSNLSGLIRIFIDNHNATEGSPGTAYFEFNDYADTNLACKRASKSWELYCVKQVPKDIENGKCFGFAVRAEEKGNAKINTMIDLINKINYWMGGSSKETDELIPVRNIDQERLKIREFNVPQKSYDFLKDFGLKLAFDDPYQEPQTKESGGESRPEKPKPHFNPQEPQHDVVDISKLLAAFEDSLSTDPQTQEGDNATIHQLVSDLGKYPPSTKKDEIMKKAREGYYSDFQSPIAMPLMQLVQDLQDAGLDRVAQEAMNGKYDI